MSSEEQKPVVVDTPAAEPAPPATETPAVAAEATKPVEEPTKTEEPKTDAPAAAEEPKAEAATEAAAAPAEEKKEKVVEPITSGTLEYKAPGFPKGVFFSKKYFWLGEDAVAVSSLSSYLRGEKPDVGHPTAAWSSQTGKGLFYFVKHPDNKANPAGVLCLADATDLAKDGTNEFLFKAHGHKHVFRTNTATERNGWFKALEKAVEEAKAAKEGIVGSDGYKEAKDKLSKPFTPPAVAAKAEGSTPKKSTEVKAEDGVAHDNSSSSSSSSDEDKKKKKSKSKSRSVSRGKRASLFGSLLGKKDEHDAKKEEKKEEKAEEKEEKKEEKKDEEAAAAATPAPVDAPVAAATTEAPAEETKPTETEAPAEAKDAEAAKDTPTPPKPTKRGSIFGTFVEKLRSPTHEKKESEVAPAVPAKDTETPVAPAAPETTEEPKATEPAPEASTTAEAATTEAKPEEKPAEKAATPHKEKKNFFDSFLHKEKAKSPTTEAAPVEAKKEEKPTEEATPEEKPAEKAPEPVEAATSTPATAPTSAPEASKDKKRTSFFGNLIRNPSKLGKSKDAKKETNTPPKVEEETPAKEESTAPVIPAPETEASAAAPEASSTNQTSIGDVVPDAVTVGQAPKASPAVHATA